MVCEHEFEPFRPKALEDAVMIACYGNVEHCIKCDAFRVNNEDEEPYVLAKISP